MKQLLVFIWKEFKHIFRDVRTLLILFGMPVAQVFLFGFAISNEVRDVKIVIWDQSRDHLSGALGSKILASEYFEYAGHVGSNKELEDGFRFGKNKMAIIIPPDFASNLSEGSTNVQLIVDASDPNMANIVTNYATAIIQTFSREHIGMRIPNIIITESRMTYNPELKGVYLFVPGVITIILLLISTLLTSIALTREKEVGTMEILLVSPLRPSTIVIGKVVPYLLLSFINALVVLAIGMTVFGMPVLGNMALLIFEFLLFILVALSLGILISTRTDSQQVAMMISLMAMMLPAILLSGFIFPIDSMPLPLQILSNIMPPKWFIIILKGVMLQGVGLEVLWKETLILCAFVVVFTAVSIKNFKVRLQ